MYRSAIQQEFQLKNRKASREDMPQSLPWAWSTLLIKAHQRQEIKVTCLRHADQNSPGSVVRMSAKKKEREIVSILYQKCMEIQTLISLGSLVGDIQIKTHPLLLLEWLKKNKRKKMWAFIRRHASRSKLWCTVAVDQELIEQSHGWLGIHPYEFNTVFTSTQASHLLAHDLLVPFALILLISCPHPLFFSLWGTLQSFWSHSEQFLFLCVSVCVFWNLHSNSSVMEVFTHCLLSHKPLDLSWNSLLGNIICMQMFRKC